MSTNKNKKPTPPNMNASTMKKTPLTHSVTRSKYGGGQGVRNTTFASSRSNIVSSASRKSVVGTGGDKPIIFRPTVQVFDDTGIDVTPLPLQHTDPNVLKKNQSNILGDSVTGTPSDLLSQSSMMYTTGTASVFGGFSRSVFSQSYDTGSGMEETAEPTDVSSWADIRFKREEVKEILTDSDLEKTVDLNLTETETIWLLDMPDVSISTESEEAPAIRKRNEKYIELTKCRIGNDRYAERGMNTFNEPPKLKQIQTTKIQSCDVGIMATTWDMYDTFEAIDQEKKEGEEVGEEGTISRPLSPKSSEEKIDGEKEGAETTSRNSSARMDSRATIASSTTGSESIFASRDTDLSATVLSEQQAQAEERIMKSDNLKRDLFNMERVINLNTYQSKQALYRGLTVMQDVDKEVSNLSTTITGSDMGPNLDRLWSYTCPLTKGRNVSCMSWNKVNHDLIAIGYGQFEFTNQKGGYVCCWSLKNPEYPERVYTCKEGVTAIDFSTANPNLLAVGFYDGSVSIYNVKHNKDEPVVESVECQGKHTAPVWHVRWVEKERGSGEEGTEVIISISTDGRVTQWSVRKGFESYDLMRLKRMPTRMAGKREKKGGAFISSYTGGLTFDFHSRDTNIYLAGTEEGFIHKCSCSYNEQYLESYTGHTGPVYKIQWSPFVQDIFLSCSADWSIRLWHQDRVKPVLSFFSSTKSVNDLCWSNISSTVFACVNDGAVEVWDLNSSTLDPLIYNNPTSGAKQTSVSFARNSECILVGDSEGQVTVYQLRCMPKPLENQSDALNNVIKASLASQLQSQETDKPPLEPDDEFASEKE